MSEIAVIGSTNTDMVIKTNHFPVAGETVSGKGFFINLGGKGANQAVAAARLGGRVTFISKVGNDLFGQQAIRGFKAEGLDTDCISIDHDMPSGIAMITVNDCAENTIVIDPGANSRLVPADIDRAEEKINCADVLLLQLEIPVSTVEYAAEQGRRFAKKIILNPAPAYPLTDRLLSMLDIITPNETEAEILTGIKVTDLHKAEEAACCLAAKGVKTVLITMGSRGVFCFFEGTGRIIPAPKVIAVDTTAAGDTFNGALAVGIAQGMGIENAIQFAVCAASISVTRYGAQASCPHINEVKDFMTETE
jgi:ribokinase